jgi:hypothetical protein
MGSKGDRFTPDAKDRHRFAGGSEHDLADFDIGHGGPNPGDDTHWMREVI